MSKSKAAEAASETVEVAESAAEVVENTEEAADESAKVTAKKTTKKTAATKAKKATGPKMYVGPTVSGIGIQNRVYTEIPEEALEAAKEVPLIKNLFIDVKDYPMANKMIREQTGYIYSAYVKVLEYKNQRRK